MKARALIGHFPRLRRAFRHALTPGIRPRRRTRCPL